MEFICNGNLTQVKFADIPAKMYFRRYGHGEVYLKLNYEVTENVLSLERCDFDTIILEAVCVPVVINKISFSDMICKEE